MQRAAAVVAYGEAFRSQEELIFCATTRSLLVLPPCSVQNEADKESQYNFEIAFGALAAAHK